MNGVVRDRAVGIARRERDDGARQIRARAQARVRVFHQLASLAARAGRVKRLAPRIVAQVQAGVGLRREELERLIVLAPDQPVGEKLLRGVLELLGRGARRPVGRKGSRRAHGAVGVGEVHRLGAG